MGKTLSRHFIFAFLVGAALAITANGAESFPTGGDKDEYLEYAIRAGSAVDSAKAQQLDQKFYQLKKADKRAADRFLRGLKFEMEQRRQLVGRKSAGNSTWLRRYLKVWVREADEMLFRVHALKIAKRNSELLANKAE